MGAAVAALVSAHPADAAGGGADRGAVLSGVVRDAQGVAQMGALVQVITGDARTVATAFTDQHGRYRFADLVPGMYQVRASATLLVPATQNHLRLLVGGRAVVNLTLATLFDTASWLPAHARTADEAADDWKWTLRATASRPILHFDDDGNPIFSPEAPAAKPTMEGRVAVLGGTGQFGRGELQTALDARELVRPGSPFGSGTLMAVHVETSSGDRVQATGLMERANGIGGGGSRVVASYIADPEARTGAGQAGVSALTVRSGQQTALGENVALEVGGEAQAIGVQGAAGTVAIRALPFVKLTAHPHGSWRLQYRMATSRETQSYADLTPTGEDVPVAVVSDGKLTLESGRHQELAVSRNAGRAVVEVAYYHDAIAEAAVNGGGAFAAPGGSVSPELAGLMLDPVTGAFRALGGGYTSNGARISFSAPVTSGVWVAAEYVTGDALVSDTEATAPLPVAMAGLHARSTQSAEIALKGKIVASGTRMRASYHWQPEDTVTRVDPYGGTADQAYLSLFVRQHLKCGSLLPPGLDATVDVTNLLAQGYRPFLSADGQTLYFAQSPRTIQAGLSFTF